MFDIAFSEMLIIAIVALVVLGPERLPKVARMAGHLLGRLQRYVNDVKADINREMQLDELKKLQAEVAESARNLEQSVNTQMQSTEAALRDVADSAAAAPKEAAAVLEDTAREAEQALTVEAAPAAAPAPVSAAADGKRPDTEPR